VRADSAVVENRELPCGVAVEPVGDAVGVLLIVEADRRVSSIAPRLRLGSAASTQCCNRRCHHRLAQEIPYGCAAGQQVGTVFAHANASVRIARNVPSDFGEPADSLVNVCLPDGHEVVRASARLE
jgi:hypothetical protein